MTVQNPAIFIQSESHPAEDVRRYIATMTNDSEGVWLDSDLAVTEKSGTPDMSVDIAGGRCIIKGDEATYQGSYFCENRGTTNVAVTASDPTNPRIDIVVARVRDSAYSGATDAWALEVIAGTPAGSPSAPAVPNNAIKLAEISVAALASSVVDANITDFRSRYNPGIALQRFAASGTFTKANYPWAKRVRVRVVGGGGGSGGVAATGSGQVAIGGGGGGGGYAESVLDIADLSASETVTIGAGGTAGASGNNAGGNGGNTSFGSHLQANGGTGGNGGAAAAFATNIPGAPGNGGTVTSGDIQVRGDDSSSGFSLTATRVFSGAAGGNPLASAPSRSVGGASFGGEAGRQYGGGAQPPANTESASAQAGAAGSDGYCIVEIFG